MTKTKKPGCFRRLWRNRPLRFTLIGLTCLMFPVGCLGVMEVVWGPCLRPNAKVSEGVLPGAYRGPDGMRISLYADGDVQVRNWPYDPFLDDGRRFDGRGSWGYEATRATNGERIPEVALGFDKEDVEGQYLVVSGTPQEPVLFEQDDPDNCPDAEFRR